MLDVGDVASAESLLRTLRRSALSPNSDMLILEAKLWDARGDHAQADALLAVAAGSEGEEALDARMVLAERRLDRGEKLSAVEMDLFGGWGVRKTGMAPSVIACC